MIHFLIDYENKNEYGLPGIRSLSPEDHVYILFSQNACKLDLNVISDTACSIHAIKVQPGRQSLDMHLVSCLGFLLNQYGTENDYYVISDDTDFDKVIEFWKERGYKVSRVKNIEMAVSPEAAVEAEAAALPSPAKKKRTSTRRTSASKVKKAAAADAVKEADEASGGGTAKTEAAEAASNAVPENAVDGGNKSAAEAKVDITYGAASAGEEAKGKAPEMTGVPAAESENDEAAETSAKDAENETAAPAKAGRGRSAQKAKSQPESVAINSHIQKFLAQNKINGTAINTIASIVAGNAGKKDRKALTYRQIIKKFGQKEGLEYYNLLKPEL